MTANGKSKGKKRGEAAAGGPPEDVAALDFEAAFQSLGEAVEQLEAGELSLDESLALYERGVALSDRCNELLTAAELRIQLVDEDGEEAGELEM